MAGYLQDPLAGIIKRNILANFETVICSYFSCKRVVFTELVCPKYNVRRPGNNITQIIHA